MADPYMHATLKCADPRLLDDELLPNLPQWYPLPPKDEQSDPLPAYTPEQRDRERRQRAIIEAITGPYDNRREQVRLSQTGAPPPQIVMADGRCIYVLSESESNKHHAVYRYAPKLSLMHPAAMRAVEDGFNEYGRDYAMEASHDDTSAMGYAER